MQFSMTCWLSASASIIHPLFKGWSAMKLIFENIFSVVHPGKDHYQPWFGSRYSGCLIELRKLRRSRRIYFQLKLETCEMLVSSLCHRNMVKKKVSKTQNLCYWQNFRTGKAWHLCAFNHIAWLKKNKQKTVSSPCSFTHNMTMYQYKVNVIWTL